MTPMPDRETCQRLSVRRSEPGTSGCLPGGDTPDEIDHVHPAGLLEKTRGRRRALAGPAIDDDRALRDLRQAFTQLLERDAHTSRNRVPPPLVFIAYVDERDGPARKTPAEKQAGDARRVSDEGDQALHRFDAVVQIADDAMVPGALEQCGSLTLGTRRTHERDWTVWREQHLRQARKTMREADVRAAGQMPCSELLRRSRVEDLGAAALSAQQGAGRQRRELSRETRIDLGFRAHHRLVLLHD